MSLPLPSPSCLSVRGPDQEWTSGEACIFLSCKLSLDRMSGSVRSACGLLGLKRLALALLAYPLLGDLAKPEPEMQGWELLAGLEVLLPVYLAGGILKSEILVL